MNKDKTKREIKKMEPGILEYLQKETDRLLNSGALDLDGPGFVPRVVWTVALENAASAFFPLHPGDKKEVRNLRRF